MSISPWPLQLWLRAAIPASPVLCCVTPSAHLLGYGREPSLGSSQRATFSWINTVDFSSNTQTSRDSIIWLYMEELLHFPDLWRKWESPDLLKQSKYFSKIKNPRTSLSQALLKLQEDKEVGRDYESNK